MYIDTLTSSSRAPSTVIHFSGSSNLLDQAIANSFTKSAPQEQQSEEDMSNFPSSEAENTDMSM